MLLRSLLFLSGSVVKMEVEDGPVVQMNEADVPELNRTHDPPQVRSSPIVPPQVDAFTVPPLSASAARLLNGLEGEGVLGPANPEWVRLSSNVACSLKS